MSILDLHADEQVQASLNTAPAPVAPPAKFSAWSAIPRGIAVAAGEVGASAADLVNAARVFRDTPSREIATSGLPTSAYSSELGDTVRKYWDDFRPDPNTASTAEQVLFGFSRGLAKVVPATIVAGPVGAIVAGIEEGMTVSDELRRKGVGADARTKAGMIQGAGLASAALPLLGTTLAETAALYVAGGPGGFMAQQALTREILQSAGYDKIGLGYDPLDPVGLAVSALIPAGFAAYGLRQAKIAQAVRDLPDLPPRADGAPAPVADALPPSELSPVAQAVKRYPQEVEDAARVLYQADTREAANPGAGMDAANKHATALARAEDQMARGEPVQVADVAPRATNDPVPANTNAPGKSGSAQGANSGKSAPDARLTRPELDRGLEVVRQIEALAEQHGAVYIRWSPGAERDMKPDSISRDFVAGDWHSGLSAVEVTGDMHYTDIAHALSEYGFLRMQDAASRPRVYLAKRVGTDSDSHALIRPTSVALDIPGDIIPLVDKKFDEAARLLDSIETDQKRLPRISNAVARAITESSIADTKAKLALILNDKSAPESGGAYATWAEQAEAAAREIRAAAEAAKPKRATAAPEKAASANTPDQFARFAEATGKTDHAEVTAAAAPARLDAIRAEYPDMMVAMDGAAPMRMDDFLAAAKAEADEMKADAPLMQLAAECALTFGL